jgi:SAM-dependent methyltransferase
MRSSFDRPLEWLRRLALRDRLRLLGGVASSDRVLEIGAGRGGMLTMLARRGGDVIGIEPSRTLWAATRDLGVRVANVALDEAEVEPRSRDLVILWHVLEHLDRPSAALERIRSWIAEGGRLVIAVPNLGSLQARLGGDRWFHQDVPRHRTQFTIDGLELLLRRTGFSVVRTRQTVIDQGLLGMWLTLLNRLTSAENVPFRFLKRDLHYPSRAQAAGDAAITLVLGLPLAALAVLLEAGAAIARRGGAVVVEARPAPVRALEPTEGAD